MKSILSQQQKKPKRYVYNIPNTPTIPTIANQAEEIAYFSTYLLPIAQKADIQTALNTYGTIRLERGDYSGTVITMTSNQKIYGHSSLNLLSNVTIASGSTGVHVEDVKPVNLILQSGGVISGCTFKSIRYSSITGTNVMFENNTLINIVQTRININCSVSGYIRNNKIIRHQIQTNQINLVLKGNNTTPSYGNVHLHTNFLTPHGDTTDLDNLQSATFVGIDGEGWNLTGAGTKAMVYGRNIGKIKITDFGGDNGYSAVIVPSYDIDATEVSFLNKKLSVTGDVISPSTNMFVTNALSGEYLRSAGTKTGFDYKALAGDKKVSYNGVDKNSLITGVDATSVTNSILGTVYTPWASPTFESIPDPLGVNWTGERVGKPDSRSYIQNLIDTNNIAQLPEGVFYIGSSLILPLDDLHGIQGRGTGKTVICGLTDDFPLIRVLATTNGSLHINNLTFQGGNCGIYVEKTIQGDTGQIRYQTMKYVSFRNTQIGIQLNEIMGMDSCFFNNVYFINCNKAYFIKPLVPFVDYTTSSYVDKVVFYKCQFINCTTPISMIATRQCNLNLWLNCKFDTGSTAFDMTAQAFPIIANCIINNFTGANVIKSNTISVYNSTFNNTPSTATFKSVNSTIEGSQFIDNATMFTVDPSNACKFYILNSTVNGNAVFPDNGNVARYPSGVYMNSLLNANPTLSKLLVKVEDKIPTVLLDATPNPYPQLLVTQ
jgi:hypothetical protein